MQRTNYVKIKGVEKIYHETSNQNRIGQRISPWIKKGSVHNDKVLNKLKGDTNPE